MEQKLNVPVLIDNLAIRDKAEILKNIRKLHFKFEPNLEPPQFFGILSSGLCMSYSRLNHTSCISSRKFMLNILVGM
jgi:hypothetical protein